MHDYLYPSSFLAYFMFFLFVVGAAFFLVRSARHGHLGKSSEEPKCHMLADDGIDANRKAS